MSIDTLKEQATLKKSVLQISEIHDKIFELPLEDYVLTFDAGLCSHYQHFDKFKDINTEKIFFITSGIISRDLSVTDNVLLEHAFASNQEQYMTLEQIKELMLDTQVTIGAHSHLYKDLTQIPKLFDKLKHIEDDTELMLNWFEQNLNMRPTKFCYPYNNGLDGMYAKLLKKYGILDFYGAERTLA